MKANHGYLLIATLLFAVIFSNCQWINSKTSNGKSLIEIQNIDQSIKFHEFNLDTLRSYYPPNDITSGRTNLPNMFSGCMKGDQAHFGFYDVIDVNSKLKPAIVAKIFVSFSNIPWHYSDKGQEVISVIVYDSLFKCVKAPFIIGDNIEIAISQIGKYKTVKDICYFKTPKLSVATKIMNQKILRYMFWKCDSTRIDFSRTHAEVEKFLK